MNVSTPRNSTAQPLRDRLPFTRFLPLGVHNHLVAFISEFVGTTFFLFLALAGTQVANSVPSKWYGGPTFSGSPEQLLYISLAFGFSSAVSAWVFFRITSGLFNPAVAFGMCMIGSLTWLRGAVVFIAQLLGGITAAALASCMFPGELAVQTRLQSGTSVTRGLFIEMLLTAMFVFAVFMMATERHKGTFIAPIGIGITLFVTKLVGVLFTGGSYNPARSFGPAVVGHTFPGYHWIYWVGPLLGSVLAAAFYKLVKALEHETAASIDLEVDGLRHRRRESAQSTVTSGHGGPTLTGIGRTLDTVREDDVEKGPSEAPLPGMMSEEPSGRYNGAALTDDQPLNNAGPSGSTEYHIPRRSTGGEMSKRDRILAGI